MRTVQVPAFPADIPVVPMISGMVRNIRAYRVPERCQVCGQRFCICPKKQ